MQTREFNLRLSRMLRIPPAEAERVGRTFLQTLGERLEPREARHFAAQLPKELANAMREDMQRDADYDFSEFVTRFAARAGLSRRAAVSVANTIWDALPGAVSVGELEKTLSRLPDGYRQLGRQYA